MPRNITRDIKLQFQASFPMPHYIDAAFYQPPILYGQSSQQSAKLFYMRRPARLYQSGFNRLSALTPEGTPSVRFPFNPAQVQLKIFRLAPRNFGNFFRRDKAHYALKIPLKKRAARSRL